MVDLAEHRRARPATAPGRGIWFSFLALIIGGALLLTLPISSKTGEFTPLLHALFTATSATCVTGLIIYDTFTHWTVFGQSVILMLIQLGGLGLVSFTTFFTMRVRGKLGLRDLRLAGEHMNFGNVVGIQQMLRLIIKVTFISEAVGALILSTRFIPMFGARGIFISVFTAVSAYCNAGFDILGFISPYTSMTTFTGDWVIMLTVCGLIICGGLGFIVFNDVLTSRKRWKRVHSLMLHSKIVLITTAGLIVGGTIIIFLLEHDHTLNGQPFDKQLLASLFSSVTPRTAGFNVIDYAQSTDLTRLFTILLMFIGASPGSTGGGVKTSTVMVLIMTVYSVVKGYDDTIIFQRRVDKSTVYKSIALVSASFLLLVVAIVMLAIFEPDLPLLNLAFEAVSAFSTTGVSAIGSGDLTAASQALLILLMYIGRVGPISFILTMTVRYGIRGRDTTRPEGKIMVG